LTVTAWPVTDMTGEGATRLPHSRRLEIMGRLQMASRPFVTPGRPPPVKVPAQRTREDGLDALLRLPCLAPVREWGTRRPRDRRRSQSRALGARHP
jgi:hypothetical protein